MDFKETQTVISDINWFVVRTRIFFLSSKYNLPFRDRDVTGGREKIGRTRSSFGRMNGGRGEYVRESKKDNGARGRDTRRRGLCRDISSCIIHTSSAMLPPPLVEAHSVAGFMRKSKDRARIHTYGDRRVHGREGEPRREWIDVSCGSAIRIQKLILRPSSGRALLPAVVERSQTTW